MWAELPKDVLAELLDPDYTGRSHHKKATYAKGCRGPLCRKAERDEAREDTRLAALAAGREYVQRPTAAQDRDLELQAIAEWHWAERGRGHRAATCTCATG